MLSIVLVYHLLFACYFQAKRTDGSDEAGIIPSRICEERYL